MTSTRLIADTNKTSVRKLVAMMSWGRLVREFYTPSDPLRKIQVTDALREEIRRRVDAYKS